MRRLLKWATKAIVLLTLLAVVFLPPGPTEIPQAQAQLFKSTNDIQSGDRTGMTAVPFSGNTNVAACQKAGGGDACNATNAAQCKAAGGSPAACDALGNFGCVSAKSCETPPSDGLTCSFSDITSCITSVIYVFTVGLGSGLAYVGGFMFDMTVAFSLNSAAYALSFLSAGWTTARDIANMAFILILVYIAFKIMFQSETTGDIRSLAGVIFIALIINFSFFLTRVVIDVGNIVAVQFYNSINAPTMASTFGATNANTGTLANVATGIATKIGPNGVFENTKDLTAGIMQALNIQELFNDQNFQSFAKQSGSLSKFIIIAFLYVAIGACYFILAAMFLAVGIKFLMRIVVLWFLIIASPLAFICKAVPRPTVSAWYDQWQLELLKHAFYPAFFLFIFLFINIVMVSLRGPTGILGGLANDLNAAVSNPNLNGFIFVASSVANVGIRLGFVVAMLYIALKASEYMGVKGAEMAQKVTVFTFGQAGRLASAPVGLFGRQTVGRFVGQPLVNASTRAGNRALLGSNFLTRGAWRGVKAVTGAPGEKLSKASYDPRNAPGASILKKGVEKITGGSINVGKAPEGGIAAQIKARAERIKAEQAQRSRLIKEVEGEELMKELVEKSGKHEALEAAGRTARLSPADEAERRALKAETENLANRFNAMDKGKLDSIKFADIEKVIKHAKEGVIKKIEESEVHSDKNKGSVRESWENASVAHSQDIVQGLKQIHHDLTTRGAIPAASLNTLNISTTAGTLIDSDQIKDLLKELKVEIPKARQRMTTAATAAIRDNERENLAKLQEARDYAANLDSARKGVPDGKGGAPKAEEFVVA